MSTKSRPRINPTAFPIFKQFKQRVWPFATEASCGRTGALRQSMTMKIKWQSTHVQLFALKDVTIGSAALSWPRGDDGQKSTGLELLLEQGVDLGILLPLLKNSLDLVGLLLVGGLLGSLGTSVDGLGVLCGS